PVRTTSTLPPLSPTRRSSDLHHDDEEHRLHHECHPAVRSGRLTRVGAEPRVASAEADGEPHHREAHEHNRERRHRLQERIDAEKDRKSTRLNSSHGSISYALF